MGGCGCDRAGGYDGTGRAEWLAVGAGGYLMWTMIELGLPGLEATRIGYGTGALMVLAGAVIRMIAHRRSTAAEVVVPRERALSRPL